MNNLNNIVVTEILEPLVVHSEKGRVFQMSDRKYYGLSLSLSGQITYEMDNKAYVSKPGYAVLLPMGGNYTLYGDKDGLFPLVNFTCKNFDCNDILIFPIEKEQSIIKNFETLKKLFEQKDSSLERFSVFYEMLSKIFPSKTKKPLALEKAVKYIDENLSDLILSNQSVANEIGISEVYLRKLFSSYFCVSPKQYILEARIQKAKQMLVETSSSVTTISQDCGFSNVYHFCRAFKKRVGLTPTDFAAQNITYKI